MIIQMPSRGAEIGSRLARFIQASFAETRVCVLVIGGEVEIVLNQNGARVRIIAHTVAAYPRIYQRQRQNENNEKSALRKRCREKIVQQTCDHSHKLSSCRDSC